MAIDDLHGSCHLYDPFHKRKYTIRNENTMLLFGTGTSVLASRHGWLLVAKEKFPVIYDSFFLYSPFTNKIIQLPNLPREITQVPCYPRYVHESLAITFTTSPDSKDCEVVVLRLLSKPCKQVRIMMCRPGDTTWNTDLWFNISDHLYPDKGIPADSNFDTACANGVVYCLFGVSSVGAFIVAQKQWKVFPYPPIHENHCRISTAHISEWDGKYLLISHHTSDLPGGYVLYRLQFDPSKSRLMEEDGEEDYWVEVKSLDNRSLFLDSDDTSVLFPVEEATGLANTVHHCRCCNYASFYHANAVGHDNHTPCPQISQIYDWDVSQYQVLSWIQPPDQPNF